MNCRELRQEIADLRTKYHEFEGFYKYALQHGKGRKELEDAQDAFEENADALLEKYLPEFQKQFGDEVGIRGAHIKGDIIKGLGDIIAATPWGDNLAVTGEGLFFIVEDENSEPSRGELIMTGKYAFGVFPMSDKKLLLPTSDRIDVIRKEGDGYSLCKSFNMNDYGEINEVVAISEHRWVVRTENGVYVLHEDTNEQLAFGEKVDLSEFGDNYHSSSYEVLPLSDGEIIISDSVTEESGVFTIGDMGECSLVAGIPSDLFGDYVLGVDTIADDKWLINRRFGYSFLYRNADQYKVSEPIDEMLDMRDFYRISYLSRNDFLVEDNWNGIFAYSLRPDGSLEKKGKLFDGGKNTSYHQVIVSLTDDTWLMSRLRFDGFRYFGPSRNYIIRRRKDGEIELGKEVEGLDFGVSGAIPLYNGKYLLLDGDIAWSEPLKGTHVQGVLDFPGTFTDIKSLKDRLDLIIEIGETRDQS